jgi:exoribonuclease-2
MIERGLLPDFSAEALAELGRLQTPGAIKDELAEGPSGIRDMRNFLWTSIDNDDSRDLDQLTVAETMPGGKVRIMIAIADVDAFVKKDSAVDEHARHNTTSVYTAAEIFP